MERVQYIERPVTIISNRAPYQPKRRFGRISYEKTVSGVISILDEIMCHAGGTWIAWGEGAEVPQNLKFPLDDPKYYLRLIQLTGLEIRHYYEGFSNRVLWPLSHYFLNRCHFRSEYWEAYQEVNKKFAQVYKELSEDRDIVWIHDFHLSLLPSLLREEEQRLSIGFFWHIPFPVCPVFRILPWRKEILRGLLGSDLIGFQVPLHAENFLQAVEEVLKLPVDRANGSISYDGRVVRVGVFPIGIDFRKWNGLASSPTVKLKAQQIREEIGAEHLVLGVDRLDYTKGIRERLLAYERFLEKNPEFHGRICLVQIVIPSRTQVEEYRVLRREIDEIIGRIAGRFSTKEWVPLRYLYKGFPLEEMVAYYLAADMALITALREGMNLVAQEYVASARDDGCLILSEFAGVAGILTDGIIVNPYDIEDLSDAIRDSLSMQQAEKRSRMERLRQAVRQNDVHWWYQSFLDSLGQVRGGNHSAVEVGRK